MAFSQGEAISYWQFDGQIVVLLVHIVTGNHVRSQSHYQDVFSLDFLFGQSFVL